MFDYRKHVTTVVVVVDVVVSKQDKFVSFFILISIYPNIVFYDA